MEKDHFWRIKTTLKLSSSSVSVIYVASSNFLLLLKDKLCLLMQHFPVAVLVHDYRNKDIGRTVDVICREKCDTLRPFKSIYGNER